MRLPAARREQVDDFAAPCGEKLGDQAAVTLGPGRLGAHEARHRLRERRGECLLPGVAGHPRRVAPKRRDPDAGELFLARLAAQAPAEILGVPVGDPGLVERRRQPGLPELRVPPRAGKAANVDERPYAGFVEAGDQLFDRPGPVSDCEDWG